MTGFCETETGTALAFVVPSIEVVIKLNALSAVFPFAVALKVKLFVVSLATSVGSPEITPVELFKDKPPNEPDCKE